MADESRGALGTQDDAATRGSNHRRGRDLLGLPATPMRRYRFTRMLDVLPFTEGETADRLLGGEPPTLLVGMPGVLKPERR